MNPLCLCLLLPIVCVLSYPVRYQVDREQQNQELPKEFWSRHFGPDFKHAVHLQLEQSDFMNPRNAIAKGHSESKDGNRKRSAYIVHKPSNMANLDRTVGRSMTVHLLQPHEIETVEREMIGYAKQNTMGRPPVVVNLPSAEGNFQKPNPYQAPMVLNVPPVVYHNNPNTGPYNMNPNMGPHNMNPNMGPHNMNPYMGPHYTNPNMGPHNMNHPRDTWSYGNKYPSFSGKMQDFYRKVSMPYKKFQPTFEYTKLEEEKDQPQLEDVKQPKLESMDPPSLEKSKTSLVSSVTSRPVSYDDKVKQNFETATAISAKEEVQDTKQDNKKDEKH